MNQALYRVVWTLTLAGFLLYTSGLAMLLAGLYQGGNTRNWRTIEVIVLIVLGMVMFIGCFICDFFGFAKRPLFLFYMFKKFREFTVLVMYVSQNCYH